jgi:hypothetical protein
MKSFFSEKEKQKKKLFSSAYHSANFPRFHRRCGRENENLINFLGLLDD